MYNAKILLEALLPYCPRQASFISAPFDRVPEYAFTKMQMPYRVQGTDDGLRVSALWSF